MDRTYSSGSLDLAQSRNKVLRNTYNLLALSLLPTAAGAWLGMQFHFASLFGASPILGPLLMLGVMRGMQGRWTRTWAEKGGRARAA